MGGNCARCFKAVLRRSLHRSNQDKPSRTPLNSHINLRRPDAATERLKRWVDTVLVLPPLNYRQRVTWSFPDRFRCVGSCRRVTLSLTLKVVDFDLSVWTRAAFCLFAVGRSSSAYVLVLARCGVASGGRGRLQCLNLVLANGRVPVRRLKTAIKLMC